MAKNKKNIYCTVCGKRYFDPIAAQIVRTYNTAIQFLAERFMTSDILQHARKHPQTQQPLVLVVPQPYADV